MMASLPATAAIAAVASLPGASLPGAAAEIDASGGGQFEQMLGPIDDAGLDPALGSRETLVTDAAVAPPVAVPAPPPAPSAAPAPDALLAAMLDALSLRPAAVSETQATETMHAETAPATVGNPLSALGAQRESSPRGPHSPSQLLAAMLSLRAAPTTAGASASDLPFATAAAATIEAAPGADGGADRAAGARAGAVDLLSVTGSPMAMPVAPAPLTPPVPTSFAAAAGGAPLAALPVPITNPSALDASVDQPASPSTIAGDALVPSAEGLLSAVGAESRVDGAVFSTVVATPAGVSAAAGVAQAQRADGALPQIVVPFDSPMWGNELASRVVTMSREQWSQAQIRVTPDELGPIEITLRFDGDKVHAQFGAVTPEAREALSSNMHRLRELLSSEGLNLGQSFVGQQGGGERRTHDSDGFRLSHDSDDSEPVRIGAGSAVVSRSGLLDEFA